MMLLLRGTQVCESIMTVCFVIFLSAVDVLQYILASAYDPNAQSESGEASPLHFAVSGGNKDCVQLLLEAGAKINAVMVTEEVRMNSF